MMGSDQSFDQKTFDLYLQMVSFRGVQRLAALRKLLNWYGPRICSRKKNYYPLDCCILMVLMVMVCCIRTILKLYLQNWYIFWVVNSLLDQCILRTFGHIGPQEHLEILPFSLMISVASLCMLQEDNLEILSKNYSGQNIEIL